MTKLALALVAAFAALFAAPSGTKTTRLSIDVWPKGRTVAAGHRHYTLSCAPAKGTVAHPGAACAALARLAKPFAATPHGVACPSLVLGPQEAHVVGTVRGVRVNAWLNLVHCGVDRWGRVKAIVPEPFHPIGPPAAPAPPPTTTIGSTSGPAPTIASFDPTSGPVGTSVTIAGANLDGTVGVQLGRVIAVPSAVSATTVVFVVPGGAATGPIKVLARSGSATSTGTFTVTG
jgi:hypothetical protein